FRRIPLLRADELSCDFAPAVNDVGFWNERRAVGQGDLGLAVLQIGIAPGRIRHAETLQELLVAGRLGFETAAENRARLGLNVTLELIERRSFFNAGLAIRGPEIKHYHLAAIIGKALRLPIDT